MKYELDNCWDSVSLHDCDVSHIEMNDNVMICYFEDGFWVTPNNKFSTSDVTIRTDKTSCIEIYMTKDIVASWAEAYRDDELYFQKNFPSEKLLKTLIEDINSNYYRFEIVTEEYTNGQAKIGAYIYFETPPYNSALLITFSFENINYQWNDFQIERIF